MATESATTPNCDVLNLWAEHRLMLRAYIIKRIKDPDLTDEILQEVLIKVYSFCLRSSGVKNLKSWLFQIAHNTIIDHHRKQNKFADVDLPEEVQENEDLAFEDAVEFIQPLLNFLPAEYALPLQLADIEGLKQAEVAAKLNLSLPATKSRIQRARQLLKQEFITCCHFETDNFGNFISFEVKDSCTPLKHLRKK